jgi:hypothetical protein
MALPAALDAIAAEKFDQMAMRTVRPVLKELTGAPNEQIVQKEVERLTPAQRDVLMKVVYVGLANDPASSTAYFRWHAALYTSAGAGSIMRVLTDKTITA